MDKTQTQKRDQTLRELIFMTLSLTTALSLDDLALNFYLANSLFALLNFLFFLILISFPRDGLSFFSEDQDVTRFLWVKEIAKPLGQDNLFVCQFARVFFEVLSSLFLLAAVIQHHLKRDKSWLANAI